MLVCALAIVLVSILEMARISKDGFTKDWIIKNTQEVMAQYQTMTVRQLHYRLVARGMSNTQQNYKRIVAITSEMRWNGILNFDQFDDRERQTVGQARNEPTDLDDTIENAKEQIKLWMTQYSKNRWENQEKYIEIWIEKKALQGVFQDVTNSRRVVLAPCKGYPSLTFLYEATARFERAKELNQDPIIIYFGDYDPSGEDIPRAIQDNLARMGTPITLERVALNEDQVTAWGLPPAPTKDTDSRSANWDGLGQVELDAVEPNQLKQMARDAIDAHFDDDIYDELKAQQDRESDDYIKALTEYVKDLAKNFKKNMDDDQDSKDKDGNDGQDGDDDQE